MRYQITEQNHRTGETRELGIIDARTSRIAITDPGYELPEWTTGQDVLSGVEDTAFIADPNDDDHIISADVIEDAE